MRAADALLYVLSERGTTSWGVFKGLLKSLGINAAHYETGHARPSSIARLLDGLGHCNLIQRGDSVALSIAPPCFARLPSKSPRWVYVGHRTAIFASRLQDRFARTGVEVSEIQPVGPHAGSTPTIVVLSSEIASRIVPIAEQYSIHVDDAPAAWKLATLSAGLDQFVTSLNWQEAPELNWKKSDFDPELGLFASTPAVGGTVRLSRYVDPVKSTFRYYLWKGSVKAEADPEWGRYLVLQESSFDHLYFDSIRNLLAVASLIPLPRLLFRSAVLCAGKPPGLLASPGRKSSGAFHVFHGVPAQIAELIARKVGQSLSICDLPLPKES